MTEDVRSGAAELLSRREPGLATQLIVCLGSFFLGCFRRFGTRRPERSLDVVETVAFMLDRMLPCALAREAQKRRQPTRHRDASARLLGWFAATLEVDEAALEVDMACHRI